MYTAATIATIGALATTVFAHGNVDQIKVDGKDFVGHPLQLYYAKKNGGEVTKHVGWYAENLDNGFVEPNSYGSPDIICHKNAEADANTISASVAAGGKVDFLWNTWPESHVGPVLTYAAKCADSCEGVDKTSLKWFKIDAEGFDGTTNQWAAEKLIKNNNTWTTTIPSDLAAGNYVLRHEIIALHGAGSENGAQNYPLCYNIEITGGGSANPEGVVGTSLYTSKDAGILFNPYVSDSELAKYEIPGPALYGSSGSGSGSTPTTPTPTTEPEAPAASSTVPSATAAPTTVDEPETPAPSTGAGEGSSDLPETFTKQEFIAYLSKLMGVSSSKARRHAREFF